MKLSKTKQKLFNEVCKSCLGVVHNYYIKYRTLYSIDSIGLDDLKQEANIICLAMFKKNAKLHGKNGFDLIKYTRRAVGWKLRDMMHDAVRESSNIVHSCHRTSEDDEQDNVTQFENVVSLDTSENDIGLNLLYGFKIADIYSHFSGKDLTILKSMIEYKGVKKHIQHLFPNDRWADIKYLWKMRIKPKVKIIIATIQKERLRDD